MTDSPDYRMYLENKFEGMTKLVNAQFITVHERLDAIEKQTTKTNGTIQEHAKKIESLELANVKHVIDCPAKPMIEQLEKDIKKVEKEIIGSWLRKHWKLFILIVIAVLYVAYSLFEKLSPFDIFNVIKSLT